MKNFFRVLKLVMKYGRAAMAAVDAFVSELERSGISLEDADTPQIKEVVDSE